MTQRPGYSWPQVMLKQVISLAAVILAIPLFAFAQLDNESVGLETTGEAVYGALEGGAGYYLGTYIITPFLAIVGIIFLIMIIYGGLLWLTGGSSTESITKGRRIFIWSILGLIVIIGAFAFTSYVLEALTS